MGRCGGRRLPGGDRCIKHERAVGLVNGATGPIDPEVDKDATGELLKDPVYAERVRSWLGDPKRLLDWRHTMARAQAAADMMEDRVRRGGVGGMVPPPLLDAIRELRQMHLAIGKLEGRVDDTTHVHVSLVNALVVNVVAAITEFVEPDRVPAALDKLRHLQAAVTARQER